MLVESILDLAALGHPPPIEAGVLGRIGSVINSKGDAVASPLFTIITGIVVRTPKQLLSSTLSIYSLMGLMYP